MVPKQAQIDDAGEPVRHEQEDDGEDAVEAVLGHHLAFRAVSHFIFRAESSPHQGVQEVALLHRALLGGPDLVKLNDADAAEEDEHDVDDDADDEAHADTYIHVDLLLLCSTKLSELKEGK